MIDDPDLAKDVLSECKQRFGIAEDAESDNRSAAVDDLEFDNGAQWDSVVAGSRQDRPRPVINHTHTFVRRVVNSLKSQRPRIKVHPTGDGARIEDAEIVEGLIRHIENRSTASVAYDTGAESAVKIGWGYWRILTEYCDDDSFDQEISIVPIRNTFTVYIDPEAVKPAGDDAEWYIITGIMKRDLYKALYPGAENADFNRASTGDDKMSWETPETIRLAEYYRISKKTETLYKLTDGTTAYGSEFKTEADRQYIAKDAQGKEVSRKTIKRVVEWFRINGDAVVEKRELPSKYIPVVRCEGNVLDLAGRVHRKGMIRDLKDPQRNFNYMTAAKIERLALTPKAAWVAFRDVIEGHDEWHTANISNHSVLVGEAVSGPSGETLPLPTRQQPAPLEAGFAEAMQSAEHDLTAIAGMPHEPGQDTKGEVVSGAALRQRQAISDISHYQYYDNQTLAIQLTGRICLDYIQVYYDAPRMQRIIGNDGVPQTVPINTPQQATDNQGQPAVDQMGQAIITVKNDMTVGKFDIVMDVGPGYETKRQEGAEAILQLMGTPEIGKKISDVGADIVVRNLDFNGADDLADRLAVTTPQGMDKLMESMPKQAKTVITALQGQLKQVQDKLQQTEADLKYGLTKNLHDNATKIQLANLVDARKEKDTLTDTHNTMEDVHTKAQTSIKVAEIRAGADLIKTHSDQMHERALAEDMAQHAEVAESRPN